jgi:hypothetical protein
MMDDTSVCPNQVFIIVSLKHSRLFPIVRTAVRTQQNSPSVAEGVAAGQGSNMGSNSLWIFFLFIMFDYEVPQILQHYTQML